MHGQVFWRSVGKWTLMLLIIAALSVSPSWAMEPRSELPLAGTGPMEQEAIGINADMVDGHHASAFAVTGHNHQGEIWQGDNTALVLDGDWVGLQSTGATGVYGLGRDPDERFYFTNLAGVKGVGVSEADGQPNAEVGIWGTSQHGYAGYFANASPQHSTLWVQNLNENGMLIEAYGGPTGMSAFSVNANGTVAAAGAYVTPASDFAEMLTAEPGLEPGDVLVIGKNGWLIKSTEPYQANVIGVYSAQPGFVGGLSQGADFVGKVPVALVGVVTVKVTIENGPIQPGDLLTTSNTPGYAMRAVSPLLAENITFPTGTILGKALTGLDEKTGTILMLVMVH